VLRGEAARALGPACGAREVARSGCNAGDAAGRGQSKEGRRGEENMADHRSSSLE